MATIQNHRKIVEASGAEERVRFALAAGYRAYLVLDAAGEVDHRRGIRLQPPLVFVPPREQHDFASALARFHQAMRRGGFLQWKAVMDLHVQLPR